jgi:hypothetical protein
MLSRIGAFRNGAATGGSHADFDQGVSVINSFGQPKTVHFAPLNAPYASLCLVRRPAPPKIPSPPLFGKSLQIGGTFLHARPRQTHGTSPQV